MLKPYSSEIHMPERLTVHYSVNYRELLCSTNKFEREATTAIESRIKAIVNSLPCVSADTCSLDNLKVTDCTASRLRRRRVSSAGVALTISVQPTIGKIQCIFDISSNVHLSSSIEAFKFLDRRDEKI